jgi:hypothetical protein
VWFKEVVKSLLEKALRKRGFFMLKYPKRGKPMLVIVQTTGSFMLCPYDGGATPNIEAKRPTLCKLTPFIEYRVKTGQLVILIEDVSEEFSQSGIDVGLENMGGDVEAYIKSLKSAIDSAKESPPVRTVSSKPLPPPFPAKAKKST